MIQSSLAKSACVGIALSGFSLPQAGAIEIRWPPAGRIVRAGSGDLGSEPERTTRRRGHSQAISERLERRGSGRHAFVRLVLAQPPLRNSRKDGELTLCNAMSAQNRNYCAEVAALTCIEHVLARTDALYYLPDGRDVHCHGALPVPLVARLSWVVIVGQSSIKGHGEFRSEVQLGPFDQKSPRRER